MDEEWTLYGVRHEVRESGGRWTLSFSFTTGDDPQTLKDFLDRVVPEVKKQEGDPLEVRIRRAPNGSGETTET